MRATGLTGGVIAGIVVAIVLAFVVATVIIIVVVLVCERFHYTKEYGPPQAPSRKGSVRIVSNQEPLLYTLII